VQVGNSKSQNDTQDLPATMIKKNRRSVQNWIFNKELHNKYPFLKNSVTSFGICNRLDEDTSGIVIIAKTLPIFNFIRNNINNHTYKKIYVTLLNGKLDKRTIVKNTI